MVHLQPINQLYALKKQTGAALILIAFLLVLLASSYMVKSLQGITAQSKQDEKTMQALNEAKQALIAWSMSHEYSPGQMPWPDRGTDGNYDGSSDCVTTAFQNSYLLGQLPYLPTTSPCLDPNTGLNVYAGLSTYPGIGQEFTDAQGNRIWYAVSKNLVYDYETSTAPMINPGISNTATWLKVLDRNGNLVSDRVAVVLMAPGIPLPNQNRSGIAGSTAYLDAFEIGLASYNNHTYAITANEFAMGEDYKHVPDSDLTFTKPYLFNDKLVFITIDELIAALERRVGETARAAIKQYEDTNGYYPYASQLGTTNNFACELTSSGGPGLSRGFLPVNHQSCSYTRNMIAIQTNLTCASELFNVNTTEIESIRFDRTSGGTFSLAQSGSCTRNSTTRCTCTGSGTCGTPDSPDVNLGTGIKCSSTGCTSYNMMGSFRVNNSKFRERSGGCAQTTFPTKTNSCSNANAIITCNTSNGTFSNCGDQEFASFLPTWFSANQWGSYVYYIMTRPSSATITVGSQLSEAMIATVGRPINNAPFAIKGSAQTRTVVTTRCSQLNEYFDSTENINGDSIFEATSKFPSANYNDQTFMVEP